MPRRASCGRALGKARKGHRIDRRCASSQKVGCAPRGDDASGLRLAKRCEHLRVDAVRRGWGSRTFSSEVGCAAFQTHHRGNHNMARNQTVDTKERNHFILELFRANPEIESSEVQEKVKWKFATSVSARVVNQLREQARSEA